MIVEPCTGAPGTGPGAPTTQLPARCSEPSLASDDQRAALARRDAAHAGRQSHPAVRRGDRGGHGDRILGALDGAPAAAARRGRRRTVAARRQLLAGERPGTEQRGRHHRGRDGQPEPAPAAPGPGLRPDLAQRPLQHQVVLRRTVEEHLRRHRVQHRGRFAQLRPLAPAGGAVGQVLLDRPRLGPAEQAQRVCAQLPGIVHAVHACTSRCMAARSARRA